ncbi:hypothetical protein BXZ70DRAFT_894911 [Cristinia sonorae]|uniref:Uncharacterized protein n=1 Tax=Cristinia sonorae TaxID=1940300 RepID=A0A8K0UL52_9AGAR|nr:hypothetical protein BXZ70DRAFT_894911 [Cristinia sonorae]
MGHERSQSSLPLLPHSSDSPPPTPLFPHRSRGVLLHAHRRRFLVLIFALLSFIGILTLAASSFSSLQYVTTERENNTNPPSHTLPHAADNSGVLSTEQHPAIDTSSHAVSLPHSPYLRGPPTKSFRDNLRSDLKYVTSWISAGWNNDVMTYMNLLYMGKITDRVSVIGIFTPSHIGGDAPPIAFGEVFNVSRFIQDSKVPMVEWDEVKDPESEVIDAVGCWNVWEAVQYYEHYPRGSAVPDWVGLDISYTRGPEWLKLVPNYEHDKCSTFWALARLAYPEDRNKNLGNPTPSHHYNISLPPDEHLLCYDYLYYACAQQSFEFEYDYAPQWKDVGKYLYWSDVVEQTATSYVRKLLGVSDLDEKTPPYITVHARHGDFKGWCWEAEKPEDCFAPLPVIARRVKEVQEEIRTRKGIDIPDAHVIMTSDEKDEAWWAEVKAMGWIRVDHDALDTVQQHGRWYPVILDAAIQSNGLGFVGTDRSTFSILSMRRVKDWHDGAVRMVKWGKKDADAHRRRMLVDGV